MTARIIALLLLILAFLSLPFPAQAAQEHDRHVQLKLIPERSPVQAGDSILIGIEQIIAPGWHTYWINPGDSGEPMTIKWHLPQGFTMSEIKWPVPHRIKIGPLVSYGYVDKARMFQELTLPSTLPSGPITLTGDAETLVCAQICVPEFDKLTLTLNSGAAIDNAALFDEGMNTLPSDAAGSWDAFYRMTPDGQFETTLQLVQPDFIKSPDGKGELNFIPIDWGVVENGGKTTMAMESGHRLAIRKNRGARPLSDLKNFHWLLLYKDKQNRQAALAVEARPDPAWLAAGRPEAASGGVKPPVTGLAGALILALLGGVILNLMPCVFPVLSMKALSLVKMSDKEKAHAQAYSLAYAAGIVVCFLLIAGTLLVLRAGGAQIGWGFQLQNPAIVLLLSWLLFLIGLNFSGLFEISGSFTNIGANLTRHEGLKGSFFTGLLAALVATPCTAPFMGAAMGYALLQPAPVALLVFAAMGIGLAFPFLLICFVPFLRAALPKPGHWMQTLREFFAFPMYASAAWLVWVYAQQVGVGGTLTALAGMILMAMILWLVTRAPDKGTGRPFVFAFAAFLTACLAVLVMDAHKSPMPANTPAQAGPAITGEAEAFDRKKLDTLLAGDDPVFVNMTAAWCITCKINEKTTLGSAGIRDLFRSQHIHYLKGDWTSQDAAITAFLERYGRNGVPLYVYYGPRANGKRPDAVLLPQILTPAIVKENVK